MKKKDLPFISYIIVNWNSSVKTIECISEISNYYYPIEKQEIIIIDNASRNDDYDYIEKQTKESLYTIKIYRFEKHPGVTAAFNKGFELCNTSSEFIIRHDNDIILTKLAILKLILFMSSDYSVGVAGPKLFYSKNKKILNAGAYTFNKYGGKSKNENIYTSREVDSILGAVMVFRRKIINQIGYIFRSELILFAEELDICMEIEKHGYKVMHVPYAIGYHDTKLSLGRHLDLSHYLNVKNHLAVSRRHLNIIYSVIIYLRAIIKYSIKYLLGKDKIGINAVIDSLFNCHNDIEWWQAKMKIYSNDEKNN